jgi:hypothetical protein
MNRVQTSSKFVLAFGLLLSGCTMTEGLRPDIAAKPLPSRLEEIAYINDLRAGLEITKTPTDGKNVACFNGSDLRAFKAKLGQGYRASDDPENFLNGDSPQCIAFKSVDTDVNKAKTELTEYLTAGFGLTDLYCKRFFVVASESQQNRMFARNVNNGLDTLINSILTLSSAGDTAIGIVNGGFGLIDGTLEGFDLAYLVGPDMPEVERLVKAEQQVFKQAVFDDDGKRFPPTYSAARGVIESYAGICSFTGMRSLVAKSVSDACRARRRKRSRAASASARRRQCSDAPVSARSGHASADRSFAAIGHRADRLGCSAALKFWCPCERSRNSGRA